MTWTGMCPQCAHDRGDHRVTEASPRAEPSAEAVLRCTACTCVVTDDGRPWPAAAAERDRP